MACCGSRRRCPQVPETTRTTIMLIEKSVVLIPGDERGILPSLSLAISVSKPSVILNRPRSLPIFKPIDHQQQIVCLHNQIGLHRGLVTCIGRSGFARTKKKMLRENKLRTADEEKKPPDVLYFLIHLCDEVRIILFSLLSSFPRLVLK